MNILDGTLKIEETKKCHGEEGCVVRNSRKQIFGKDLEEMLNDNRIKADQYKVLFHVGSILGLLKKEYWIELNHDSDESDGTAEESIVIMYKDVYLDEETEKEKEWIGSACTIYTLC